MNTDSHSNDKTDLRSEPRIEAGDDASVEFIPGNHAIPYQFKLKDFSEKGVCILVRKDSKVLQHIKAGDVLTMKYHPEKASANPVSRQTEIRHISEPEPGKHEGHMLVGLMVVA